MDIENKPNPSSSDVHINVQHISGSPKRSTPEISSSLFLNNLLEKRAASFTKFTLRADRSPVCLVSQRSASGPDATVTGSIAMRQSLKDKTKPRYRPKLGQIGRSFSGPNAQYILKRRSKDNKNQLGKQISSP
ncbi:hypothetical protein Ciccas_008007 [Cichlidogyrus casuarinus]|uniref:Uncharacterized protein n=1 Tax=Cichlidogyrus casuarinus TaxID=1844966 RepID=A0ABD2Q1N1_9PLAT